VVVTAGKEVRLRLNADRKHANGRLYNPYKVEAFLSGCKIEILKVVELVTWL
jgi:hypothetical protein